MTSGSLGSSTLAPGLTSKLEKGVPERAEKANPCSCGGGEKGRAHQNASSNVVLEECYGITIEHEAQVTALLCRLHDAGHKQGSKQEGCTV